MNEYSQYTCHAMHIIFWRYLYITLHKLLYLCFRHNTERPTTFTNFMFFLQKLKLVLYICCLALALLACTENSTRKAPLQDKQEIDSLIRKISDTDTLKLILTEYEDADNLVGQMMTLKQLGKHLREQNKFADAIDIHTRGLEIAAQLCDTPEIVYALNNIGTNYRRMSMLEDATTFHYRALKYCEEYSDKETYGAKKNKVVSLNGIGNISLRLKDYETADSVFRAALKGEQELGSALGQAINYANLGAIYEYNDQLDSAWVYFRKSMEMNQLAKSDLGISLCHGYFGELYELQNNIDSAIIEYRKAYAMKDMIDALHWLNSCLSLAQLYYRQGNLELAHQLLTQAEGVALQSRSRDHSASIYALLSQINEKTGHARKALEYYKKSSMYSDSIVSEKNLMQIQNERVQYEYHRRQQEVEALQHSYNQEKNAKRFILWSMIAIAFLSALVVILLLYTLRMKKKRHKELQQISDVRTSFFTNITHEFRTPLTAIIGIGDELCKIDIEEESPEKISKMGAMISRQGNNLLLLINQILDIQKMKSVANIKEYKHGDIAGYIHLIIECTRKLAHRKHITLLFSPSQPQIMMDFIPDYINKIITNLVANAIKFTPENGRIYITADIQNDQIRICVADNGRGINRDEIPHIFDIFYQGHNGKIEAGSGIGLSLTRQLVEAMNGEISVHSAENEGSVFIVTLPIKQGDTQWEHVTPSAIDNNILHDDGDVDINDDEIAPDDDKPIILVVEDNNDILSYIGSVINDAHIKYAHNGIEGIELATDIIPDIIITDIMMPEMNGLEMCREIRQSEILNHIPVIAITAKSSEEDKIEGIKAGINAYIYKPFNTEELNATITTTLNQRRLIQENFIRNHAGKTIEENNNSNLSNADQAFINKVIDVIYSKMSQHDVNPTEIASALCISLKQLSRKVTAITGVSLGKYILQVRMNKAQKLFDSNKGYSVADVAHLCGYEENSNFTRAFKQVFGITPSQYLKQP